MCIRDRMKKEPFKTVFIHGLVRDDKGRKMSKSLGNGIDPLELSLIHIWMCIRDSTRSACSTRTTTSATGSSTSPISSAAARP